MTTKRMVMAAIMTVALAGLAGPARGEGTSLTLKAVYFLPTGKVFRDTYSGGPAFGADLSVPIAGALRVWAGGEFFGKSGLLPVSEDPTKVRLIPLYAGLRVQSKGKKAQAYFGAAAAYVVFHEQNVLGTVNDGGLGWLTQAGVLARLGGSFWLDFQAGYRACTIRKDDGGEDALEAKLDGFSAGLGLAFRF